MAGGYPNAPKWAKNRRFSRAHGRCQPTRTACDMGSACLGGGGLLGQRPVEIRRQPRLGAFFLVEGRLQQPVEIAPDEAMEHLLGVEIVPPAQEMKPFRAIGH